jgi:hypothetical protein
MIRRISLLNAIAIGLVFAQAPQQQAATSTLRNR